MKIEIIRGTVVNGKPARVGQVVSADPKEANALINMGKAILYQNNRAIGLDAQESPQVVTRLINIGKAIAYESNQTIGLDAQEPPQVVTRQTRRGRTPKKAE